MKLELLTSPSYTKITQLKAFCLWRQDGYAKVHCRCRLLASASNVAPNDAVDIDTNQNLSAEHSNFKTFFCNEAKTPQLVLHYCGYSLSSNHMTS